MIENMIDLIFFKRKKDYKMNFRSYNDWPDYIITLEEINFNDFIEKYPFSIVDFWAPWCSPCKTMSSRLRRLSKIYKGKIAFGKLNTEKNQDIVKKYKIMGIPHLVLFNYEKKITSITGLKSVGYIKNIIGEYLVKL
jgi:thioredoxin 1